MLVQITYSDSCSVKITKIETYADFPFRPSPKECTKKFIKNKYLTESRIFSNKKFLIEQKKLHEIHFSIFE